MRVTAFGAQPAVRFGHASPPDESPTWKEDGFPNAREHGAFKRWVRQNDLNSFGDPQDTMYAGMSPLFTSGKTLYQYATERHPDQPWLQAAPQPKLDLRQLWQRLMEKLASLRNMAG